MAPGSRRYLTHCSVSTASDAKSASASRIDTSVNSRSDERIGLARVYVPLLLVGLVVVALDQVTKQLALDRLAQGPYDVIEGVLRFRLTFNPGGAFGLFQDYAWVFLVATLVIVAGILIGVRNITDARWSPALGLVLGGGLGNAIDRLFRDTSGAVVDFIDLHVWPVFNIADMAIVCGSLAILFVGWRTEDPGPEGDTET
jgi:signal peptidase II